jgi:Fe(3+) dicitrate transport protein
MATIRNQRRKFVLMASVACVASSGAFAQQGAQPAEEALPEVQVIQKKTPAKKAAPVAKKAAPAPSPAPLPPQEEFVEEAPALANSPYGAVNSRGAQARAEQSAQTPINPTQLIPQNLDGFSAAATNLTPEVLTERQPRNVNEALTRVPGVAVINDDANAHHGGIGIRGAPPRRSRKMLVMEDGHTVNLALWLDPSVHYWAPVERMESVEVLRGTVITHGPNNNFGVINSRNLSPFGPDETVISSAIGFTRNKAGSYRPIDDDIEVDEDGNVGAIPYGDPVHGKSDTDISARWHVHTRQHADNVGLVASYTGANVQGAWDTERLRVHDFYGALGWKGSSSDLVVSAIHARQKDNYDEQNFLGSEIEIDFDDGNMATEENAARIAGGLAEQQFRLLKHCKTCYAPAAGLNTYTGEVWRGQVVHNAYLDDDTTITTRFYAGYHRRDRYQLVSAESDPSGDADDPPTPIFEDGEQVGFSFDEDTMFGRLRTFRHVGGEVRGEWANRNVLGFRQDLQAGIRYEYQDMTNKNVLGLEDQILKNGDKGAATFFDRSLDANTVSAFLQSNIYVARDFNVLPGIRFEWFEVGRRNRIVAAEEGEAEEVGDDLVIEGIDFDPDPARESFSSFNALPGIAFAYTGLHRTTIFGGYHRGLTTSVLRNEDFPSPDEIGDNFNLGLRSTAIRGLDLEIVGFYQRFKDFQYGESFSNITSDREFGRADEAEIKGIELFGRLNSQPFTGGPLNFFAEGNYTYARGILKKANAIEVDEDDGDVDVIVGAYNGNRIPEAPWHVAALTLGVEGNTGWRWNASATWTYRGSFFTDAANTPYGLGGEYECESEDDPADGGECEIEEAGEGGGVPSVWLLSARFNLDIGDTGASVWVAGDNLLDKFYISDREDGMKPGLGRTVWAGFKYKF